MLRNPTVESENTNSSGNVGIVIVAGKMAAMRNKQVQWSVISAQFIRRHSTRTSTQEIER